MAHQQLIFVSIASYRDPQLIPTIEDALAKAANPQNLRFGICWQHAPDDAALPFADDPRFRIRDVDWHDSQGCCWARAECMQLFDGEDWFLQIDAHQRFVQDWDAKLLDHAARTGSAKPVLTGLAPGFQPDDPNSFGTEPLQTNFDGFGREGVPESFATSPIVNWRERREPVRARFITAGFIFAPGSFPVDVPYDPQLYFYGEETTLTIRAFTHGYDLFHPTEIILWHLYDAHGKTRPQHGTDHQAAAMKRDYAALRKVRAFLDRPTVGRFGCGTARTFADYQDYAGISFTYRCAALYTRQLHEPPNPPLSFDWAYRMPRWNVQIHFFKALLKHPPDAYRSLFVDFWSWERDGDPAQLIYRHRFVAPAAFLRHNEPTVELVIDFASELPPVTWSVWPSTDADYTTTERERIDPNCHPKAWAWMRCIGQWQELLGRVQQAS